MWSDVKTLGPITYLPSSLMADLCQILTEIQTFDLLETDSGTVTTNMGVFFQSSLEELILNRVLYTLVIYIPL